MKVRRTATHVDILYPVQLLLLSLASVRAGRAVTRLRRLPGGRSSILDFSEPLALLDSQHGLRTMKRRKRDHQRALIARLTRHVEISLDCLRPRRIRTRSARYAAALGEMLGFIERPRCCVWCRRRGRLQRHHWDYAEPLNVTFLCPDCHAVADGMVASAQSA